MIRPHISKTARSCESVAATKGGSLPDFQLWRLSDFLFSHALASLIFENRR